MGIKASPWRRRIRSLARGVPALGMAVVLLLAARAEVACAQSALGNAPLRPGQPFPPLAKLKAINTASGQTGTEFKDFDLEAAMRGRFLVLVYWAPEHPFSEDSLKAVASWAEGKANIALVSVVPPRGKTAAEVRERAGRLGLDVPIVWDESYQVGNLFRNAIVPSISVVDPSGVARLIGAASLRQELQPGMTLAAWLDTAVHGGTPPTITEIPRYYPVRELIDRPFIDFTLNRFGDNSALRFSDYVRDGKLTLLVFWSADCPHCQRELPLLNDYYKKHQEALSIIGVIRPGDAGLQQRTRDFIRLTDLRFPTVVDQANKVWGQYRIITTPTTVVVKPNGVVDTVLIGSDVDLEAALGPGLSGLRKSIRPGA